ncbi:MAG TPA: hypothetical protein VEL69_04155 [Ktedonobacteraceae bacterium]|nr:hypothetical protein [Ktedonobacteraceae bacterium]
MKPWMKFQDGSRLVLGAVLFQVPWLFGTAVNKASSCELVPPPRPNILG